MLHPSCTPCSGQKCSALVTKCSSAHQPDVGAASKLSSSGQQGSAHRLQYQRHLVRSNPAPQKDTTDEGEGDTTPPVLGTVAQELSDAASPCCTGGLTPMGSRRSPTAPRGARSRPGRTMSDPPWGISLYIIYYIIYICTPRSCRGACGTAFAPP